MTKTKKNKRNHWIPLVERLLPHALVAMVSLTVVLSWLLGPTQASQTVPQAGAAAAAGTPIPTPSPDKCTEPPLGYDFDLCGKKVPTTPRVEINSEPNNGFYLAGSDASIEAAVSRIIGNRKPQAVSFSLTTAPDTVVSSVLSATDADGDSLSYEIVDDLYPRNGTLSRSGADITYTPNPGFVGWDSFAYVANDGRHNGPAVVTIRVGTPSGPAPSIQLNGPSLPFGGAVSLAPTVQDGDNDTLEVWLGTRFTLGKVTGAWENFSYDPLAVFGEDHLFIVADELTGSLQRSIRLVSITIEDPDATSALYDGDPDEGGTQIATSLTGYGNLRFSGLNTTAYPDGPHTFFVKTVDAAGRIAKAAGDFEIDNTPPTIEWDQRPAQSHIRENITIGVTASDNIRVQGVKFDVMSGNQLVRTEFLTQPPFRKQNYDIRGLSDGPYAFKFYSLDNAGNVSTTTLSSTYIVDNNAPSVQLLLNGSAVNPAGGLVMLNGTVTIQISGSDAGAGLSLLSLTFGAEATPRLSSTTSPVVYEWDTRAHPNGAFPFVLRGRDTIGNETAVTFSNVRIQNNNAPVATPQALTLAENGTQSILLQATDVDDPSGSSLVYSVITPPTNGRLTGSAPNLTYQPDPGFDGTDFLLFEVSDGAAASTGRVDLTITGSNDPPVAIGQTVTVAMDSFIIIMPTGHDPEKGLIAFSTTTVPSNGVLEKFNGGWKYIPTINYAGPDSFSFVATDGLLDSAAAIITITVEGTPVNTPPTVVSATITAQMGQATPITLSGNDSNGDSLVFRVVTAPVHGSLAGDLPNLTFVSSPSFRGADSLIFVANDGLVDSAPGTITINVVDTISPSVAFSSPAAGATVSEVIVIEGTASDNDSIQAVEIYVDSNLLASRNAAPFSYSLNTRASLSNGSHLLRLRAIDPSGNATEVTRSIAVSNPPLVAPTIELTNPVSGRLVSGLIDVLAQTTGNVSSVDLTISGPALPMSPTSGGKYAFSWDTRSSGLYPDGSYTVVAKATGPGGTAEVSINVTVDNTAPTSAWVLPTPQRATEGLFGIQAFVVNANDANGVDHVQFWFANTMFVIPTSINNEFTFLFDTRNHPDGANYAMQAVVVDRAGNQVTSAVRTFKINNTNPPPSQLMINELPLDGAFVSTDEEAQISASFNGNIQLPVSNENLRVYVSTSGIEREIFGTVTFTGGRLRFIGTIPPNAQVRWVVDVRDTNNQRLSGQFRFVRNMIAADGGEVYYDVGDQSRFKLIIPPGSLPTDMLVAIDLMTEAQIPSGVSERDSSILSEGQRTLAGPFKTYGRTASAEDIHTLVRPATVIYADLRPPQQADEQTRAVQIQGLDGMVWRPIGTSEVAKVSNVPGTRTISVPISSLSTFRVNSVPVPANGIDFVYADENPFDPREAPVNLHYNLNANSDVTIAIYDLFGNLVRTLRFPAGSNGGLVSNDISWDGRNGEGDVVANGGYILQIVARDSQGNESKARYKIGVVK